MYKIAQVKRIKPIVVFCRKITTSIIKVSRKVLPSSNISWSAICSNALSYLLLCHQTTYKTVVKKA